MPSPVDKYYKKVKENNPTYSDAQAWATAWSIFCKHVNPGSPSCHLPEGEYLKGREANVDPLQSFQDALIVQRVSIRCAAISPSKRRRPSYKERLYTDLDDDSGMWCAFGEESGFAYASFSSEAEAKEWVRKHPTNR